MELQGAKPCFDFILLAGLAICVFISDRHLGIAKWIRENHPKTSHFYDIWHVARSITKKLVKAGKQKGYEKITYWVKGVQRHLYRQANAQTSCLEGNWHPKMMCFSWLGTYCRNAKEK